MEEWKDIEGYNGVYQVSSLGNVRTFSRWPGKGRLLKPQTTKKGYRSVRLYCGASFKFITIHRLVAKAFIINTELKPQVNHINGNRADNRVENLEWVTGSENVQHSIKNFGKYFGEAHSKALIKESQVIEMRKLHAEKMPVRDIATKFNINWNTLRTILYGYKWKRTQMFTQRMGTRD